MTEKDKQILHILTDEWHKSETAMQSMQQSLQKCQSLLGKESYSFEDMEAFDSLAIKFSRNSDILFQKIFKSILLLYKENPKTFLDNINFLCKINVIPNTEMAIEVREYRNEIVHEYFIDQIISLYPKTIEYTEKLLQLFQHTKQYLHQKKWINT